MQGSVVRSMSVRSRLGVCGSASSGASVGLAAGSVAADGAAQGAPSSAPVKLKTTAKAGRERIWFVPSISYYAEDIAAELTRLIAHLPTLPMALLIYVANGYGASHRSAHRDQPPGLGICPPCWCLAGTKSLQQPRVILWCVQISRKAVVGRFISIDVIRILVCKFFAADMSLADGHLVYVT